jgi:serine/threonine-protein kinase
MLTGAPPFRREDDMALLWAHQYDEPPPPTELRAGLPTGADAVVARALAKAPDDRFDSCLDFVAALRSALAPQPLPPPPTTVGHAPTRIVHAPRESRSGLEERPPPGIRPPPRWAWPVYSPGSDPTA